MAKEKQTAKQNDTLKIGEVTETEILEVLTATGAIKVPEKLLVRATNQGSIDNDGDKLPTLWANMTVVDPVELEALTAIGYEDNVKEIKVKVTNFDGKDLSVYEGKTIEPTALSFVWDKTRGQYQKIVGIRPVLDADNIVLAD